MHTKFDEIVKQAAEELGCEGCQFLTGDCCRHSGALAPVCMLDRCPRTGKSRSWQPDRFRRHIDRWDRTDMRPPLGPWNPDAA